MPWPHGGTGRPIWNCARSTTAWNTDIRAHILLCWLDLLLVRIMETRTGRTWAAVREELQDLHVGAFTQTSQPTAATKTILAALDIPPAKNILRLDPAT
ncbi:MAG: transposase [Actinomycetota bacterium]|nr:transposase [Actinomycetota bacterium]